MLGRPTWLLTVALLGLGCSFDKSALQGIDAGPAPQDAAPDDVLPPDATGDDAGSCSEGHRQCSGAVVQQCTGGRFVQVEVCPLDCKVDEARCYTFAAANVDDGSFDYVAGDLVIDGGGTPTLDTTSGILSTGDFPSDIDVSTEPQTTGNPELLVIRCRDFVIGASTHLTVTGSRALVVLASGEIRIEGVLEASANGSTGGAGGFGGGGRGAPGAGPGAGSGGSTDAMSFDSGGGSGAGNGGAGGAGGVGGGQGPAVAGLATGDRTLRPLYGGSGGGGGADTGDAGGGGGGAIQLSAARQILVTGTIVTVGAGGGRGTAPTLSNFGGGSGGGSGGAVLLEAPEITVDGGIAVGGGGGGGAGGTADAINLHDGTAGSPGQPNGVAAQGGAAGVSIEGAGGAGGSIGAAVQPGGGGNTNGGGGGGGPGRALFASKTGHSTLSPGLSSAESGGLTAESVLIKH
jgi:hypothetical protein